MLNYGSPLKKFLSKMAKVKFSINFIKHAEVWLREVGTHDYKNYLNFTKINFNKLLWTSIVITNGKEKQCGTFLHGIIALMKNKLLFMSYQINTEINSIYAYNISSSYNIFQKF